MTGIGFFGVTSIVMGVLLLVSKSRKFTSCKICGCCSIIAGGFVTSFFKEFTVPESMFLIWFWGWTLCLPIIFISTFWIGLQFRHKDLGYVPVIFGIVSVLSNILPPVAIYALTAIPI